MLGLGIDANGSNIRCERKAGIQEGFGSGGLSNWVESPPR